MINIDDVIFKLSKYFNVSSNIELAEKLETSPQTLSNWKSRNSIKSIQKKCRELNIYDEIFGSLQQEEMELENSIFTEDTIKKLNIIKTMISDNQELENDFNELLKSFIKENL